MAGPKKQKFLGRFFRRSLLLFLKLFLVAIFITLVQVALLRFINPPFTAMMASGWIKSKVFSKSYVRPQYNWRPLRDISPWLIKAVLAGEDQRFMSHHGFDFIEINRAVKDIIYENKIRGASTITMQVSRAVFLWPGRSLLRKAAEAYYTMVIELFLTKLRILEIYLNVVDWGDGVMGAEAASRKYFRVSASDVTPSQAARMAAILPNPHKWSPTRPNGYVKERQARILRDMQKMHL